MVGKPRLSLARALASRWRTQTATVEAPTLTQSPSGESVPTWNTVYAAASVFVAATSAEERDQGERWATAEQVWLHFDPALVILPTYRVQLGDVAYQVIRIDNQAGTRSPTLRVLAARPA